MLLVLHSNKIFWLFSDFVYKIKLPNIFGEGSVLKHKFILNYYRGPHELLSSCFFLFDYIIKETIVHPSSLPTMLPPTANNP